MFGIQPWLALLVAMIGNCGFWLFCFNRVNAFGYPRPVAKTLEKVCICLCFIIPAVIFWWSGPAVWNWLHSSDWLPQQPGWLFTFWLCWSLLSIVVIGPFWLESRRWLIEPPHALSCQTDLYHVHQQIPGGSAESFTTKCLSLIPLNELAQLSVTRKELLLPRPIVAADGLKIGHLSDLHFTGQYRQQHYDFVVQRTMELGAEMIIISGDIIDYDKCLPMIQPVLGQISAPLGVYFVLGNHDRRLKNVRVLLDELAQLGFHDLGIDDKLVTRGSLSILLTGNEQPWFERHTQTDVVPSKIDPAANLLRIGVAHSPDKINWARRKQLDLMLAGHTHGGQARFPIIGPLVAPSMYGSKFASGVFFVNPTLMHVSRGVAGTHPLRWRCPPEVSLLTLCSSTATIDKLPSNEAE